MIFRLATFVLTISLAIPMGWAATILYLTTGLTTDLAMLLGTALILGAAWANRLFPEAEEAARQAVRTRGTTSR